MSDLNIHSSYEKRVDAQGRAWLEGRSIHNVVDDECCPDFSCCVPARFESDRLARLLVVNLWRRQHGFTILIDA